MLISSKWFLGTNFVWGHNPVPSTITMSSQTPSVFESWLISGSSSESYHHTWCWTCRAQRSWVISPNWRLFLPTHLQRNPWERCFINIQTPNVIDWLSACITAKYKEVRFRKYYCVAIASSWSSSNNRYDHPLCSLVTVSQVKKVKIVWCQTSSTCRSSIDNHLEWVNLATSVSRSRGWGNTRSNYESWINVSQMIE